MQIHMKVMRLYDKTRRFGNIHSLSPFLVYNVQAPILYSTIITLLPPVSFPLLYFSPFLSLSSLTVCVSITYNIRTLNRCVYAHISVKYVYFYRCVCVCVSVKLMRVGAIATHTNYASRKLAASTKPLNGVQRATDALYVSSILFFLVFCINFAA